MSLRDTLHTLSDNLPCNPWSWVEGNRFQFAQSCDATCQVLAGTLTETPEGTRIVARITYNESLYDMVRFMKWMTGVLISTIVLLTIMTSHVALTSWLCIALGAATIIGALRWTESRITEFTVDSSVETVLIQSLTTALNTK